MKIVECEGSGCSTKKYRPNIDISKELGSQEASYLHYLIGTLRWIVELGRVDIFSETSMISSYLALPRCRHLESLFHVLLSQETSELRDSV